MIVLSFALGGCGLPRSGPTKAEIFSGSVQRKGDAYVLEVNDRVTKVIETSGKYSIREHLSLPFKVKKSGKVKRGSAFRSHILSKMSQKQKRRLRNPQYIADVDSARVKTMLGMK